MFKVNNKDTRTTPYFTPYSSVFIVDFELVNTSCDYEDAYFTTSEFQSIFAIRFSWFLAFGVCFKTMYAVAIACSAGTQLFLKQEKTKLT